MMINNDNTLQAKQILKKLRIDNIEVSAIYSLITLSYTFYRGREGMWKGGVMENANNFLIITDRK